MVVNQDDEKIKKFVKVMSLRESDLQVLKFWISGLGKQHRATILAAQ